MLFKPDRDSLPFRYIQGVHANTIDKFSDKNDSTTVLIARIKETGSNQLKIKKTTTRIPKYGYQNAPTHVGCL